ncbi:hypothetical protein HFN53_17080 [Rhizobium leguminosarum]|nr:hypothetical protein [Rhizobium leguminosarum]
MDFSANEALFEAQQNFDHLDFDEGFAEFKRIMESYRSTHLSWPAELDFTDWVHDNVKLAKQESSRPGPMKLSVYQREIGNSIFHDPLCRQVTVLKGVQIGYSKLLRVIFAYAVAYMAWRVSVVFPTEGDMERFYKDELATLYQKVKAVIAILRARERGVPADSEDAHRYSNGAIAYFRAAFNEADLQGFTSKLNLGDELDRPGWLPRGATAGNKVNQLRNRGVDFHDSKVVVGSTPGVRSVSVIWQEWLTSDQRRLFITCPHCRTFQELRWGSDKTRYGFRWDLDEDGHVTEAYYKCDTEQDCVIREEERGEIIEAGRYMATTLATVPGNVGIHAPSWISMSPGATWKVLAQKWLNAQGDTEKLKEFVTSNMAEPWDDFDSRSFTDHGIRSNRVPYPAEVPDDVIALVAGGDDQTNKEGDGFMTQASREVQIVGFNRRSEPRVIGHWVVPGEVGEKAADDAYRAILDRPYKNRRGQEFYVQCNAMDMGGHHAEETVRFAASMPKKRLFLSVRGANVTKGKRLPTMLPTSASKSAKGLPFYTVDTQRARDIAAAKLVLTGENAPMWPDSMPVDFEEKLTCEQQTKQPNGGYWWNPKPGRRAEEEWACFANAIVAWEFLRTKRPRVWGDLNLAAETLGIPDISHDPDTGEIDYEGPDMSVIAVEARAKAAAEPKTLAAVVVQQPKPREQKPEPTMTAVMPTPVPASPLVQQQPRRARIVRSSSIW